MLPPYFTQGPEWLSVAQGLALAHAESETELSLAVVREDELCLLSYVCLASLSGLNSSRLVIGPSALWWPEPLAQL